jgi:alkanesulfonate monooxygenase SsuD/methylene tetrahydromethanopterin reductase-like flavin-dependent oxidoreductase (luciferase family)
LDKFEISSQNFVITGRTEADLQSEIDRIRRQIAFYASTRTYKVVMDTHGWGDVTDKLFQLSLKGQVGGGSEDVWKEMAKSITDEIFNEFVIVATYDTVAKRIKERFGGLVTRIAMSIPTKSPADEEAAKDVLRQLHQA